MRTSAVFAILFSSLCFSLSVNAATDGTSAPTPSATASTTSPLFNKYQQLKDQLNKSIFGSPILLNSNIGSDYAEGEVYAVLETSFAELSKILSQPAQWCELAILHINIKTCVYQKDRVTFYVGRKHYQPPEDAYALRYHFEKVSGNDKQLHIKLSAAKGSFGTSNYLIDLEAVAIDEQHSFIRFQYRYQFGFMASMAMKTYLATLGRNKVGFTVTGENEQGEPIYIKGLQGVIERNVMRYIFAIQSVLDARKSPTEFLQTAELVRWYANIQKHPRQLLELTREEYMDNKKRELKNQLKMQEALQPVDKTIVHPEE
jgi:hypothetical protein